MPDDITLGELARQMAKDNANLIRRLDEIRSEFRADLAQQRLEITQRIHQETYAADQRALTAIVTANKKEADAARKLSMWAIGLLATAILGAGFMLLLAVATGGL